MRTNVRGSRGITSVEPSGKGWAWTLRCGHVLVKPHKPEPGQKLAVCGTCRNASAGAPPYDYSAQGVARTRAWRQERGLCWNCTSPRKPGHTLCERHLEYARAQYHKRKARSSHQSCEEPKP